jgi:hypothetical protein
MKNETIETTLAFIMLAVLLGMVGAACYLVHLMH